MKKVGVFAVVLLSLILTSSFVSASAVADALKPVSAGAVDAGNFVVELLNPLLKYLIGDSTGLTLGNASEASGIFLARILMLLVVFSLAFIALEKMDFFTGNTAWAKWIISVAVSILGVRFISESFIWNVILSNMAFAVTVTVLLPFVLFFFFVKDFKSETLQRVAWVVFAVAMLLLWAVMVGKGTEANTGQLSDASRYAVWFYPIGALAALAMAIWSGALHRMRVRMQEESAHLDSKASQAAKIRDEQKKAREAFADEGGSYAPRTSAGNGKAGKEAFEADMKYYKDKIVTIMAN
jgi:hypothetical protein